MNYTEQTNLAKQIFEKLGLNVDLTGCFNKIIKQLTIEQCLQVLNLVDDEKVKSEWAFNVGKFKPKNRKDVMDFICDSKFAYNWAFEIGNKDVMIDRVTDSKYAYYWALKFGDRDVMIHRITNPEYAYLWALNIGNKDVMFPKFVNTKFVFDYIECTNSCDDIKELLTDTDIIIEWVNKIGDKDYFTTKFPELSFT